MLESAINHTKGLAMSATKSQNQLTKHEILAYLTSIKPELEKVGITKLGLFGSYAKDRADIASDIDITIEMSDDFLKQYQGFKGIIYLENLRESIMRHFKIQVDLCDTTTMPNDKKANLLKGVIYV